MKARQSPTGDWDPLALWENPQLTCARFLGDFGTAVQPTGQSGCSEAYVAGLEISASPGFLGRAINGIEMPRKEYWGRTANSLATDAI